MLVDGPEAMVGAAVDGGRGWLGGRRASGGHPEERTLDYLHCEEILDLEAERIRYPFSHALMGKIFLLSAFPTLFN